MVNMPIILTIDDLEADMETVTTIGKEGQVMRVLLLISRWWYTLLYLNMKIDRIKKLDENSKEGTNIEGVETNKRENEHHMMHRWSWSRWLSRPCQEHMISKPRTICEILFQIKLIWLG